MILLARAHALEVRGDCFVLRARGSNDALARVPFVRVGEHLSFAANFPSPTYELCRLISHGVFGASEAQSFSFHVQPSPAALQVWAQVCPPEFSAEGLVFRSASFAAANRALGCKGAAWMERSLPNLSVAAIALVDGHDRVLLAQRPEGKSFAGLWEFPGGKVEPGESPELALCREVEEELGLTVWNSCFSPLTFVSHAYADFHLTMLAYVAYKYEGEAIGREGQVLRWWPSKELDVSLMPPANAPLVHAIQDLLG